MGVGFSSSMGEPPWVLAWVLEEEAMTDKKGREEEEKREGKGRKKRIERKRATVSFFGFSLNLEKRTMVEEVWSHNRGQWVFKKEAIIAQPPEQSHHGQSMVTTTALRDYSTSPQNP